MREAYLLEADDLSDIELEQPDNGATFSLDRTRLWIDKEFLVPIRLLMEGKMEKGKEVTPITIEKLDLEPVSPSLRAKWMSGAKLSEHERQQIRKEVAGQTQGQAQEQGASSARQEDARTTQEEGR